MKNSFHRLLLPIAAMAFIASTSSFAASGKGGSTGAESGPVIIPGGTYSETYIIAAPGSYRLGGNRAMSDTTKHIIQIAAPDVTLDLGGFALSYPSVGKSGIRIPTCDNVEIRNGSIANAFDGVEALSGNNLRIIDVRIASAGRAGIRSFAAAGRIDRCQIADAVDDGIWAVGAATLVTDCIVLGDSGFGITVSHGGQISRSTVSGAQRGLLIATNSTASDCTITGCTLVGVYTEDQATLRNLNIAGNALGVHCGYQSNPVIMGTSVVNNNLSVSGSYVNGGGNVIQ